MPYKVNEQHSLDHTVLKRRHGRLLQDFGLSREQRSEVFKVISNLVLENSRQLLDSSSSEKCYTDTSSDTQTTRGKSRSHHTKSKKQYIRRNVNNIREPDNLVQLSNTESDYTADSPPPHHTPLPDSTPPESECEPKITETQFEEIKPYIREESNFNQLWDLPQPKNEMGNDEYSYNKNRFSYHSKRELKIEKSITLIKAVEPTTAPTLSIGQKQKIIQDFVLEKIPNKGGFSQYGNILSRNHNNGTHHLTAFYKRKNFLVDFIKEHSHSEALMLIISLSPKSIIDYTGELCQNNEKYNYVRRIILLEIKKERALIPKNFWGF